MICDHLSKAGLYVGVTKRLHHAFEFLRRRDLASVSAGRHPIVDDNVFALVQEYQTKPIEQAKWEAHRKYLDVQFVASGVERMGYGYIGGFKVVEAYDESKDVLFLDGSGNDLILSAGMFAIFSPHDAHRPMVAVDRPTPVRKLVVKVRID